MEASVQYMNEAPEDTLREIQERLSDGSTLHQVSTGDVRFDLTKDKTIHLGEKSYPSTGTAVTAFGDLLDVPSSFLDRLDADLAEPLLTGLIARSPDTLVVRRHDERGIIEVNTLGVQSRKIEPRQLVEVAAKVIDWQAPVTNFWCDSKEFRLDVIAPEGFDRGTGGKVGDITRGGVRIGQNRKQNTAPWVSQLLYRLICTNGMEATDESFKVDARGQSAEEWLAAFEVQADRAFKRVEGLISAFYALDDEKVDNPERVINRLAHEQGLSDRVRVALLDAAPGILPDEATMFDVTNLITNQANQPGMRDGLARQLQQVGGTLTTEHAARCGHCASKLN